MRTLMARLLRDDEGQDLVEYVLLVSLIALVVAAAFPPVTVPSAEVFTSVERGARRRSAVGPSRAGEVCGAHVVASVRA